jgi:hypothetical protein
MSGRLGRLALPKNYGVKGWQEQCKGSSRIAKLLTLRRRMQQTPFHAFDPQAEAIAQKRGHGLAPVNALAAWRFLSYAFLLKGLNLQ